MFKPASIHKINGYIFDFCRAQVQTVWYTVFYYTNGKTQSYEVHIVCTLERALVSSCTTQAIAGLYQAIEGHKLSGNVAMRDKLAPLNKNKHLKPSVYLFGLLVPSSSLITNLPLSVVDTGHSL